MRLRKTTAHLEGKIHLIAIEWYQQLIFFNTTVLHRANWFGWSMEKNTILGLNENNVSIP